MKHSVFAAKSYRAYLSSWLEAQPHKGRGLKSRMAEEIGTKSGFITQVFQELADFSLEQAFKLAEWMALPEVEREFFLLLVQRDRAGTRELTQHFNTQLERRRAEQNNLSQTLETKRVPSEVDQATYFSSWLYACVHVLLTCKGPHSPESVAQRLAISVPTARRTLEFLVRSGLANERSGIYKTGEATMHLGTDSPNLLKHHLNWNLRAIQTMEADLTRGLHYSSIVSLAKEDFLRLREELVQAIAAAKALVKDSPGELLSGFTLNLFEVGPAPR